MEAREIKLKIKAVDGWKFKRVYKSLEGARRKAQKHLGKHPEFGMGYAVANDGVVTCSVEGATLEELFPSDETVTPAPSNTPKES